MAPDSPSKNHVGRRVERRPSTSSTPTATRRTAHAWAGAALAGTLLCAGSGCGSEVALTPAGHHVVEVSEADLPDNCTLLGDVAIGWPPDAARPRTQKQLVLLMRNKTAEQGGNHVVLDSAQERHENGHPYYVGRARAYDCHRGGEAAPHEPHMHGSATDLSRHDDDTSGGAANGTSGGSGGDDGLGGLDGL